MTPIESGLNICQGALFSSDCIKKNRKWTCSSVWCVLLTLCITVNSENLDSANLPVLSRCCPLGFEYSVENDNCVAVSDASVQYQVETTTISVLEKSLSSSDSIRIVYDGSNATEEEGRHISLPSKLVIPVPWSQNATEYRFRLIPNLPRNTCTKGNFIVKLEAEETNESTGVVSDSARLTSRGELKFGNEYYSPTEFCLFGFNDASVSARVCNATCSEEAPCIRKCCDLNQVWNLNRGRRMSCMDSPERVWTPQFYRTGSKKSTREIHPHYVIHHPRAWCNLANLPRVIEEYDAAGRGQWRFRLNENGVIFRRLTRYKWSTVTDDYMMLACVDGGINSKFLPPDMNDTTYSGLPEDDILFECSYVPKPDGSKAQSVLYGTLMIFSCIFLLLTLLVYILLWDRQTVHGWTLMSYIVSLFFMYVFFALVHLSKFILVQGSDGRVGNTCKFIGIGLNFFFLSTFCWMSMINFDLWCTFKALKPTGGKSKGIKRYIAYATFSTLVPLGIVSTAVTLDVLYGSDYESGVIVPQYGKGRCHADPEYGQLVYFYGPAGILLVFNLAFFIFTVYAMYKIQQSTKFATNSSSKSKTQKQSVKLFAKLLVVMGIPWIFEVISWAVQSETNGVNPWYWAVFDIVNILQAIAIFFIFVFKREIIHSLEQKYPSLKALFSRILLDADTADRIGKRFPCLQSVLAACTKRNGESNSTARSVHTDSTVTSESSRRGDIRMQDNRRT